MKYFVNGKSFDTYGIGTTKLCSFKVDVFTSVTIYVVNDPVSEERIFYQEEVDADDGSPIQAYELSPEEAHELCMKNKVKETFEIKKCFGGGVVISLGNNYEKLTGFTE